MFLICIVIYMHVRQSWAILKFLPKISLHLDCEQSLFCSKERKPRKCTSVTARVKPRAASGAGIGRRAKRDPAMVSCIISDATLKGRIDNNLTPLPVLNMTFRCQIIFRRKRSKLRRPCYLRLKASHVTLARSRCHVCSLPCIHVG